jgi:hypothetical protein
VDLLEHIGGFAQQRQHARVGALAQVGQRHAAAIAMEQGAAAFALQRMDLPAHGRLHRAQRDRGLGQAPGLGHFHEHLPAGEIEMQEFHKKAARGRNRGSGMTATSFASRQESVGDLIKRGGRKAPPIQCRTGIAGIARGRGQATRWRLESPCTPRRTTGVPAPRRAAASPPDHPGDKK